MTARIQLLCDRCGRASNLVTYTAPLYMSGWTATPDANPAVMDTHLCPECAVADCCFEWGPAVAGPHPGWNHHCVLTAGHGGGHQCACRITTPAGAA